MSDAFSDEDEELIGGIPLSLGDDDGDVGVVADIDEVEIDPLTGLPSEDLLGKAGMGIIPEDDDLFSPEPV